MSLDLPVLSALRLDSLSFHRPPCVNDISLKTFPPVTLSLSCPSLQLLFLLSIPPCQCATMTSLRATHSSIRFFTSPAKSLSNRCHAHSFHLPSVRVCVCCVCVIMRVCVWRSVWACVHVCAPAEKAWPRLIAASYLVVTGLIKDDEPSLSPLSLSDSLPSFGRKTDRQPPVPHYGLFLERKGEWEDDGKRGASRREESKEGQSFSFLLSPLKRTERARKKKNCRAL